MDDIKYQFSPQIVPKSIKVRRRKKPNIVILLLLVFFFLVKRSIWKFSPFSPILNWNVHKGRAPGHFFLPTLHTNSLNPMMAVTTLLPGGLYSIGCLDILSRVARCVSLTLSKAGHLVQQCLCLSLIIDLFSVCFYKFKF